MNDIGPILQAELPRLPMNANTARRSHWRALKRELDGFLADIPPCPDVITNRRVVKVTFYVMRLNDVDNLHVRAKSPIDAVKRQGWIKDDSPEWCDLSVEQVKVAHRVDQKTRIVITNAKEAQAKEAA